MNNQQEKNSITDKVLNKIKSGEVEMKPKIYFIDQKLAIYRMHIDSRAHDRVMMKNGFIKAICKQRSRYNRKSIEYKLLTDKIRITKHNYGEYSKIVRFLHKIIFKIKKY